MTLTPGDSHMAVPSKKIHQREYNDLMKCCSAVSGVQHHAPATRYPLAVCRAFYMSFGVVYYWQAEDCIIGIQTFDHAVW